MFKLILIMCETRLEHGDEESLEEIVLLINDLDF